MNDILEILADFATQHAGIGDKTALRDLAVEKFSLVRDRSVYASPDIAIRFSSANTALLPNTVLSLSNLQKYDDRPFVVCIVTPSRNYLRLANTTLLKKVSHSSHALRIDNIRGSFNGSDISSNLDGIENDASNLRRLFAVHDGIGFEGNLARLVAATNQIVPSGNKFEATKAASRRILDAPSRALDFLGTEHVHALKVELDQRVEIFENEILLASQNENVNVRGRVIEYLIAGEDQALQESIAQALQAGHITPEFSTGNALGDYSRSFPRFQTATDVKTKIMNLSSNPKGYNIDKVLEFLATEESVFMFYFVGIDGTGLLTTCLVSMFEEQLLGSTRLLKHWAGQNSRGVTQFDGRVIRSLLEQPTSDVDVESAARFLERLMELQ